MTASKSGQKRTVLTDDGEIQEVYDEPEPQQDMVYCTRCGTPNPPDSSFCRKCGHSIVEQEASMMGVANLGDKAKGKHGLLRRARSPEIDPAQLSVRRSSAGGLAQLAIVLSMTAMSLTALRSAGGLLAWIALPVLAAWFLVEGVRGGRRGPDTLAGALNTAGTAVLVAVMVNTALNVHNVNTVPIWERRQDVWIAIPPLVAWFLVEGVRGGNEHPMTAIDAINSSIVTVLVTVLVLVALLGSGGFISWISVPLLAGWFLIEGIRNGRQP